MTASTGSSTDKAVEAGLLELLRQQSPAKASWCQAAIVSPAALYGYLQST